MLLGHPLFIGELHPDIRLVFLPLNTPSEVQLADQGVAASKACSLQRTLAPAIAAAEEDTRETLVQLRKGHGIGACIRSCAGADVTRECTAGS